MIKLDESDGWISLSGSLTAADLRKLAERGALEKLNLSPPLLTAKIATGLSSLESVNWLRLWCDVLRTSMRHVIAIPGLRTLEVRNLRSPGSLPPFVAAKSLETAYLHSGLTERDLVAVTHCRSLRTLGIQSAELNPMIIERVVALPHLQSLDLEASNFDDAMAARLSAAPSIQKLYLGATRITRSGLERLVDMQQLTALDLWATAIDTVDLQVLTGLPNLESLTLGAIPGDSRMDTASLIAGLAALPALKRVWLVDLDLEAHQVQQLQERYAEVRIS